MGFPVQFYISLQVLVSVYEKNGKDMELILNITNAHLMWKTANNGINKGMCMQYSLMIQNITTDSRVDDSPIGDLTQW